MILFSNGSTKINLCKGNRKIAKTCPKYFMLISASLNMSLMLHPGQIEFMTIFERFLSKNTFASFFFFSTAVTYPQPRKASVIILKHGH